MLESIPFIFLALILGFKHSYDADHIVAVSNILRKVKSLKSSIKIGLNWAVGHMATATIITIFLYIFRESIIKSILPNFEKIAGLMLIILGLLSLKDFFLFHLHKHKHGNITHSHFHLHAKNESSKHAHKHILGIGIIHGLASNDELLTLFTASLGVTSLGVLLLGIGVFSIGVVLGMVLFSFIFTYPLIKLHNEIIYKIFSLMTGLTGIIYGSLMIFALV